MASKVCSLFVKHDIIPTGKKAAYTYGLELLISDVVGISCIILISILYGQAYMWIPYLIGFVPMRILGGGYHAKTHFSCILFFSAFYLLFISIKDIFQSVSHIEIFLCLFVLFLALLFSPVEAENKPLSGESRKRNRRRSIGIAVFNLLLAFLSCLAFKHTSTHLLMYFVGTFSAGISIIFALLTQKNQN